MSVVYFVLRFLLLCWALLGAAWPGHTGLATLCYRGAVVAALAGLFYPKASYAALALVAVAALASWGVSVNPGH